MKYEVVVTRIGSVFVEAESKDKAKEIANNQTYDEIYWDEDWYVTDCHEFDGASVEYVTE